MRRALALVMILLVLTIVPAAKAEGRPDLWAKTYGGSSYDEAYAVAIAPNGDIIVAGYTWSFGSRLDDFWVLRLDGNGNVKWQKTYGGKWRDEATGVAIADNGDIIVAGWTVSFGAGYKDVWVLRLDENGELPYSDMVKDSSAEVEATNADIGNKNAEIETPDVVVKSTDVNPRDSNANIETQYSKYDQALKAIKNAEGFLSDSKTLGQAKAAFEKGDYVTAYQLAMKAEQAKKTRQTLFALMLIALAGAVAGMYYRSQKKKEAERLRGEVKSAIEEARKLRAEGNLIKAAEKLKVALEKARNLGDVKAEVELELSKLGEELSKALSQGDALLAEGKYAEAIKAYESALPLAQALGREKEVKEKISLAERKAEEDKKRRELEKLLAEISGAVERKDYERVKELMDNVEPLAKELNAERKLEAIKAELKTRLENLTARAREEELSGNYSQALALYTEALSIAGVIGESGGEIRKAITTIEERQMEELLRKSVRIEVPSEMAHTAENEVSILVTNRFSGDISVSVDLSANRDYFELSEEKVEFPRVKPGKTIGEDVTVKPKFLGEFDFTVKVNSSAGSFEKRVPVKVVKTARAGATPTPTPVTSTPVINPVESLTELYSEMQYIGEGGFARVYKAKRKDGKVVAVKIPKTLDPAIGRAFVREISNWLHLKHSNIVELYDVNVIPIPYLEMEYCESSLAKLPKPLPLEEASLIVFNIAEGLKYAHSKKIVHRDLKPSNVLLKNGLPKISDWGLSKVLEESMSATTTASFTPFYAAPEQIDRKFGHTDERTDIWQLGVIFYELVTGRLPFEGSLSQVMMGIIRDDPVPPSEINPEAKKVEPIIMKMLAKRKEERYQSIEELQRDLAGVLNLTYSESLKKSKTMGDVRRAAYYLTELLLINMKTNNVGEAYKYATDLVLYARGELKDEVRKLAEQQKLKEKTNYESFKINGNEARKFSQRELKKLFEECLKSNGAIISLKTEEQEAIIFIPIREDLEWN